MSGDASALPVVLVVAGWYPSVDSRTSGRFIADQCRALAATGRVRPVVLSFDPLPVWGSPRLRRLERTAAAALLETWSRRAEPEALHAAAGRSGAPGPVARVPVPAPDAATPPSQLVDERAVALERVVRAMDSRIGDVTLVHAHTGLPDGAAAARLAARLGVPLVLTEHASTLPAIAADPTRRAAYLEATSGAAAVIAVSRALADDVLRIDPGVGPRLRVVPNVVHVEEFAAPETGRRSGELLFVGARKASKGIAVLLEATRLAARERSGLTLRLIGPAGTPAEEARWRAEAAAMGPAARVVIEGEAGRAAVADAMARADLFVHPSPRETFGVVAAEALASGLPVVAADSGGVTEVLGPDPDRYGRVVPPGDPTAMAQAILEVLAARSQFQAAGSRAMAAERFGAGAVAARLIEVYEEAGAALPMRGDSAGAAARALADPAPSGVPQPMLVIGLDRDRAARVLADLSPAQLAMTTLVTASGHPELPSGLAHLAAVRAVDVRQASIRQLGRMSGRGGGFAPLPRWRRPIVLAQEAVWRSRPIERLLLSLGRHAADRAARRIAADGAALPGVVALDGVDAMLAAELVAAGRARAMPGGARWLADAAPGELPVGASAGPPATADGEA